MAKKSKTKVEAPKASEVVEQVVEESAPVQEIILLNAEGFAKKKQEFAEIAKDLDAKAKELYENNKQVFYSNINGLFFQVIDLELEGLRLGNVEMLISELSKESKLRPGVQKRLLEHLSSDLKSAGYQLTDEGFFVVG